MARRGENIYKRKDGRYEGRYVIGRTESGKTRFGYVYGQQYTQVRNELMRKKAENARNRGPGATQPMTLQEWMEGWLSGEMRSRLKPASLQTYTRLYSKHILPCLGYVDVAMLTAADLYAFLAVLDEKKLSLTTQKSVLRLISAAMRSAMEEGLIRKNPCAKVRLRAEEKEQRVLTAAEQEQLKRASMQAADIPALLGLYTGMRLGEICALRWEDVDWPGKTITVRHTVQRMESAARADSAAKTALAVSSPKSLTSRRVLPVPDFILSLLKTLRETSASPYVFGTDDRAAEPRTMQRRFKRMTERLALSGVHFHTTRHTFATRMLEIGVDVKTVSVMLGHSTTKTTLDFYAHSLIDRQRLAIDQLSRI